MAAPDGGQRELELTRATGPPAPASVGMRLAVEAGRANEILDVAVDHRARPFPAPRRSSESCSMRCCVRTRSAWTSTRSSAVRSRFGVSS